MEQQPQAYVPRTNVAYAPTEPFANAFPREVEQQTMQFTTPSWAQSIVAKEKEEAVSAPEQPVAKPIANPSFVAPGNPLLDKEHWGRKPGCPCCVSILEHEGAQDLFIGVVVIAGVFLLGYVAYKYLWSASASSSVTSTPP